MEGETRAGEPVSAGPARAAPALCSRAARPCCPGLRVRCALQGLRSRGNCWGGGGGSFKCSEFQSDMEELRRAEVAASGKEEVGKCGCGNKGLTFGFLLHHLQNLVTVTVIRRHDEI